MSVTYSWQLPRDSTAPAQARWHLRELATSEIEAVDAELVVTELVTNAWKHGRGLGAISLRVDVRHDCLHIEVCGDAVGMPELILADDASTSDGRGLLLIDGLARDWGFERRNDALCVWADVAYPP